MDSERVDEIKQALEAVSPIEEWDNGGEGSDSAYGIKIGDFYIESGDDILIDDCDFIRQSPTWIRELLPIVEAAKAFLTADVYQSLVDRQMEWADDQGDVDRLTALWDALGAK